MFLVSQIVNTLLKNYQNWSTFVKVTDVTVPTSHNVYCVCAGMHVRTGASSSSSSYAARAAPARAPGSVTGRPPSPSRSADALVNELSESSEIDDTMINLRKTFAGIFGNA